MAGLAQHIPGYVILIHVILCSVHVCVCVCVCACACACACACVCACVYAGMYV